MIKLTKMMFYTIVTSLFTLASWTCSGNASDVNSYTEVLLPISTGNLTVVLKSDPANHSKGYDKILVLTNESNKTVNTLYFDRASDLIVVPGSYYEDGYLLLVNNFFNEFSFVSVTKNGLIQELRIGSKNSFSLPLITNTEEVNMKLFSVLLPVQQIDYIWDCNNNVALWRSDFSGSDSHQEGFIEIERSSEWQLVSTSNP